VSNILSVSTTETKTLDLGSDSDSGSDFGDTGNIEEGLSFFNKSFWVLSGLQIVNIAILIVVNVFYVFCRKFFSEQHF
jgi:hypothetical protein